MNRHPLNVFALVFGMVLILLAVWATWVPFPGRGWSLGTHEWLVPAAVILVGAALMSPVFTAVRRKKTSGDETGDGALGGGEKS